MARPDQVIWPPDYLKEFEGRFKRLKLVASGHQEWRAYYATRPVEFINHWCVTYDPRNAGSGNPTTMPFIMFPKQEEMVEFLYLCVQEQVDALFEKARDMGATWVCCAFSVWLWLFMPGSSVGWGSRKENLVDKLGDPDSIFEKMRMIIRNLPKQMLPSGFNAETHMPFMKIVNPENGATITGESGDNIGRGGRKLIYFKDEAAHYERPEKIEAALGDNTRCQVDISSVNGLGNVFHRRRESGVEWKPGNELSRRSVNVFILDWRDHPAKDQAWYDERKAKALEAGLGHLFAQEVDRNYSASIENVIIDAEWVEAAIDADKVLGLDFTSGGYFAGLDIADGGGDKNALAVRKGSKLLSVDAWGERDTGATTRRVVDAVRTHDVSVQYDSIGVGSGVKAEANRLADDGLMPDGVEFVKWNAGAAVINPDRNIIDGDKQSPTNKDFYANLKAQAWWQLRLRFERTYRAVKFGEVYSPDEMITIPSDIANIGTLKKELSQATHVRSSNMKMMVDKTPEGTKSPNMADAVVMAFWPLVPQKSIFDLI